MKRRRAPDNARELRELSFQVGALANLLKFTGGTGDPDLERFHWGLGEILDRLGRSADRIAREVERIELSQTKNH